MPAELVEGWVPKFSSGDRVWLDTDRMPPTFGQRRLTAKLYLDWIVCSTRSRAQESLKEIDYKDLDGLGAVVIEPMKVNLTPDQKRAWATGNGAFRKYYLLLDKPIKLDGINYTVTHLTELRLKKNGDPLETELLLTSEIAPLRRRGLELSKTL